MSARKTRLAPPVVAETEQMCALRTEVRTFLRRKIDEGVFVPKVDTWLTTWDEEFTRELAAQGWVGMTIPTQYGGHGRSFMERFVVTEELLAVGAPVAAHWVADRQVAPSLLRFGTEMQKQRYLPRIARGECSWAIGMSEPDSGSDLAAVRTSGTRMDGGWRVTGRKIWTSGADRADAFFCLARTSPRDAADRHAGLSQFIVELDWAGVEIRPIVAMNGSHHFNEVLLDGVFVPDDMVFGRVGDGWLQVTSELGYERSGPERILSTFPLFAEHAERTAAGELRRDIALGRTLARFHGLHQMSMAVSGALERGEEADTASALVKVLGTTLEGDVAEAAHLALAPRTYAAVDELLTDPLAAGVLQRPGFTLRGGTNEILRGVIARGLGMR